MKPANVSLTFTTPCLPDLPTSWFLLRSQLLTR
jgi:hypothetical protein